jgi:hypothetical protein
MKQHDLQNAICFLCREYGGVHINKKRFEIIQQLINQVIINMAAPSDNHGNFPYVVSPPPMTLPYPSTLNQWKVPRRTAAAKRADQGASDMVGVQPTGRNGHTTTQPQSDGNTSYHTDQTSQLSDSAQNMELDSTIRHADTDNVQPPTHGAAATTQASVATQPTDQQDSRIQIQATPLQVRQSTPSNVKDKSISK